MELTGWERIHLQYVHLIRRRDGKDLFLMADICFLPFCCDVPSAPVRFGPELSSSKMPMSLYFVAARQKKMVSLDREILLWR